MKSKSKNKDEQLRLVMECRTSGLSDYQWCRQNDILPGTFYNWIKRLRKAGYTVPDRTDAIADIQEVVKLDVVDCENTSAPVDGQNACILALPENSHVAAQVECGSVKISIFNGADPAVTQALLQAVGGIAYAR